MDLKADEMNLIMVANRRYWQIIIDELNIDFDDICSINFDSWEGFVISFVEFP